MAAAAAMEPLAFTSISSSSSSRPHRSVLFLPARSATSTAGPTSHLRFSATASRRRASFDVIHRRRRGCGPHATATGGSEATPAGDGEGDSSPETNNEMNKQTGTANTTTTSTSTSSSSNNKRGGENNKWKRRLWRGSGGVGKWIWEPIVQGREMGLLLLQLGFAIFALRMLRPEISLPGSEPRPQTTIINVAYSDFLGRINSDQVKKVEVDGVHIMFRLRPDAEAERERERERQQEVGDLGDGVGAGRRVVYTTTRPVDIKTPYEKMVENKVEFGSPDKRSGGFWNSALVRM